MIAYNTTKLFHLRLLKKAKQWFTTGLLSTDQYATVRRQYKVDIYSPNFFIKIGLFLFTWVSVLAAAGLFSIFFFSAAESDTAISVLCLMLSGGCVLLLEKLIKRKNLYRSGIDEALLYAAILFAASGIGNVFFNLFSSTSSSVLFFTILMMPVLTAAIMRYADRLVAIALALCCYIVCFLLLSKLGSIAKLVMPFAMMLLPAGLYIIAKRLQQKPQYQYWQPAITTFECIGLLFFYVSANYCVIRESGILYFGLFISEGTDIPLAIFFYLFTAIIPLLYVLVALKRKDRILLWMGLVTTALSAITFKYYFSITSHEVWLIVAGLVLTGIAYAAIKYLRTPKQGITFEEDAEEENFLRTNGEALLQARSFGHATPIAQAAPAVEFGGGSSGGAGATSNW